MAISDVDQVLTDDELSGYIGGMVRLQELLPEDAPLNSSETLKSARLARLAGFARVMNKLTKKTPPITAADISDPKSITVATAYATLEQLYLAAPKSDNSPNLKIAARWGELFEKELTELFPVVDSGSGGGGSTSDLAIAFERG